MALKNKYLQMSVAAVELRTAQGKWSIIPQYFMNSHVFNSQSLCVGCHLSLCSSGALSSNVRPVDQILHKIKNGRRSRFVPSCRSSASECLLANRCNVWQILELPDRSKGLLRTYGRSLFGETLDQILLHKWWLNAICLVQWTWSHGSSWEYWWHQSLLGTCVRANSIKAGTGTHKNESSFFGLVMKHLLCCI